MRTSRNDAERTGGPRKARGGGTGGGPDDGKVDQANQNYAVAGNTVQILARIPPPSGDDPPSTTPTSITLLATGNTPTGLGSGGTVAIRGNQGVRVTAGPPLPLSLPFPLPASADSTDGIELIAVEGKVVRLEQGTKPLPMRRTVTLNDVGVITEVGPQDCIRLDQGVPGVGASIVMSATDLTVDAGAGALTLQSVQSITLKVAGGSASITLSATGIEMKVAGGTSSITLGPKGVSIKGLMVNVN